MIDRMSLSWRNRLVSRVAPVGKKTTT